MQGKHIDRRFSTPVMRIFCFRHTVTNKAVHINHNYIDLVGYKFIYTQPQQPRGLRGD